MAIEFSRAYLIKSMTGSHENSRWWQAGTLAIDGAELESPLPDGPLICVGGLIEENIYAYRDMLPVPFRSQGRIRCELRFGASAPPLVVSGTGVSLEMRGVPKYIEHLHQADKE